MDNFSPLVTGVGGIVLLVALMIWLIASRYRVARLSEAYTITGQKGKAVTNPKAGLASTDLSGQKIIMGSGVFVIPLIQRLYVLDLSSRHIMVQIHNAVSRQGIKLSPDSVAIVKAGSNEDSVRAAAQRFLVQQKEIETFTQEALVGVLRSIVGDLSMEQIVHDRAAFTQWVADEPEASPTGQGLVLDIFQIQDITDDGTYLSDLERPGSAKVGQIAVIAETSARREAEQARLAAEQGITISERELILKEAEIKVETNAARAQAAAAGPLAQAGRDQAILTEQEKVAVRQAALKNRQLSTEIRKPADTKRYETEATAQGRRNSEIFEAKTRKTAVITNAGAQAGTTRLTGEGEKQRRTTLAKAEAIERTRRGEAEKVRRIVEADAVRAEGETRVAVTFAAGTAETGAMGKRTTTFANYNKVTVLQVLIEVLPQIAEEVTAPIGSIDKLTVVSTKGAAALPRQINNNVLQTVEMIRNTTSINLLDILKGHTDGKVFKGETAE